MEQWDWNKASAVGNVAHSVQQLLLTFLKTDFIFPKGKCRAGMRTGGCVGLFALLAFHFSFLVVQFYARSFFVVFCFCFLFWCCSCELHVGSFGAVCMGDVLVATCDAFGCVPGLWADMTLHRDWGSWTRCQRSPGVVGNVFQVGVFGLLSLAAPK